jgi:hypothetical protein
LLALRIEIGIRYVDDRTLEDGPAGRETRDGTGGVYAMKLHETAANIVLGGHVQ